MLGLLAEEPLYGYDLLERFHTRSIGSCIIPVSTPFSQ